MVCEIRLFLHRIDKARAKYRCRPCVLSGCFDRLPPPPLALTTTSWPALAWIPSQILQVANQLGPNLVPPHPSDRHFRIHTSPCGLQCGIHSRASSRLRSLPWTPRVSWTRLATFMLSFPSARRTVLTAQSPMGTSLRIAQPSPHEGGNLQYDPTPVGAREKPVEEPWRSRQNCRRMSLVTLGAGLYSHHQGRRKSRRTIRTRMRQWFYTKRCDNEEEHGGTRTSCLGQKRIKYFHCCTRR